MLFICDKSFDTGDVLSPILSSARFHITSVSAFPFPRRHHSLPSLRKRTGIPPDQYIVWPDANHQQRQHLVTGHPMQDDADIVRCNHLSSHALPRALRKEARKDDNGVHDHRLQSLDLPLTCLFRWYCRNTTFESKMSTKLESRLSLPS